MNFLVPVHLTLIFFEVIVSLKRKEFEFEYSEGSYRSTVGVG